jgi:hypothetical protein
MGGRCVAFAHEQFGHAFGDGRGVLFENAIKWASRKSNPSTIVMGLTTNMDAGYFVSRGYQVVTLDRNMKENNPDPMPGCDVLVIDFHGAYSREVYDPSRNRSSPTAADWSRRSCHGDTFTR